MDFYSDTAADRWMESPNAVETLIPQRQQPTELWLREPQKYLNVLAANPYPRLTYHRIYEKYYNNPDWWRTLYPSGYEWSCMSIGRAYTLYWSEAHLGLDPETAVRCPSWSANQDPQFLVRICKAWDKRRWPAVVVGWLGKKADQQQRVAAFVYDLGVKYPDVPFHLTLSTSSRIAWGLNFHSADRDPERFTANPVGQITLPNGKVTTRYQGKEHLKWIHVLGYSLKDLDSHDARIQFNIASALWAANNWNDPRAMQPVLDRQRPDPLGLIGPSKDYAPHTQHRKARAKKLVFARRHDPDMYPQMGTDPDEPYATAQPIRNAPLIEIGPRVKDNGDKILCDSCSLAPTCRVYREGAVCALTNTPTVRLSQMFGTRDASVIADALKAVVEKQADRYQRSADTFRAEDDSDIKDLDRSKHLMAMENSLMRNIEGLIKVVDPAYRESLVPAIQSNVMHVYNPNVLVADVVKDLEARGYDRSQITPEVIANAVGRISPPPLEIIESTQVEEDF